MATQVMQEIGIDIASQQSKDLSRFSGEKFDWVITVCDRAKESCPAFFGAHSTHWSLPDPDDLDSFRRVRDELSRRIDYFLKNHSDFRS
jgi:protein-tyrosine-phosphatase